MGLDRDGDGAITWGEVRTRHPEIAAYALARLELARGGSACTLRAGEQLIDRHTDGAYTVLRFTADCVGDADGFTARYSLFFDIDPQHRGVASITHAGQTSTLLFRAEQPVQRVDVATGSSWRRTVVEFWRDGVWHIWAGFDHILFLLALLMPAVLRREDGAWHGRDFRDALMGTLEIVTAFTVAHSITLSLAALGAVQLPVRIVESAIAASVVIASLNNIWPVFGDRRWLVGFGFGLLHGFGFANVLADTDLPHGAVLQALFGFNLGVESGQLAIVCVFLPLAYATRRSWAYQRFTLVLGSSVIALLAMIWLVERALDVSMLS